MKKPKLRDYKFLQLANNMQLKLTFLTAIQPFGTIIDMH